jgi:hypothetical protein
MTELPYNASRDELEELRRPKRKPLAPPPNAILKGQPPIFRTHGIAQQGRSTACVDEGLWMIRCGFCGYYGPGLDERGQPHTIYQCPFCQNSAAGKRLCEVLWPEARFMSDILAVLMLRPEMKNRNWVPGETVEMLERENLMHGLPTGRL